MFNPSASEGATCNNAPSPGSCNVRRCARRLAPSPECQQLTKGSTVHRQGQRLLPKGPGQWSGQLVNGWKAGVQGEAAGINRGVGQGIRWVQHDAHSVGLAKRSDMGNMRMGRRAAQIKVSNCGAAASRSSLSSPLSLKSLATSLLLMKASLLEF